MFRRRDRREEPESPDEGREVGAGEELDELDDEVDEIEGEQLEDQPEDMTADLESQAADYLADNDAWMYGPNAGTVLEILDRLEEIGPYEARPLAEAWLAIPRSDRDRARRAARKLAEADEELARYLQMAREACGAWMSVTGPFPEFVNADPDWGRLCAQSGEAALDAATAVILEGKLEEIHYESLLEPWSEAMAQLDAAAEAAKLEGAADSDAEEDLEAEEEEEEEDEGKFGPNSDDITDFLNRLWLLAPEQVGRLVSGWQNSDRDDLKRAHEALQALADEDPEYRDQVRKAQEELTPWLNAGRIEQTSGFLGQTGQGESRKMAGPALADAIAALALGDLLEPRDAAALYGPWFNLIGAPPLPAASTKPPATGKGAAKSAKPGAKAMKPAGAVKPAAAAVKVSPAAKGKAAGKAAPASGTKPDTKPGTKPTTGKATKK
jgi:hypothetical protein